jgi:sugar lactone lactonase YvrE
MLKSLRTQQGLAIACVVAAWSAVGLTGCASPSASGSFTQLPNASGSSRAADATGGIAAYGRPNGAPIPNATPIPLNVPIGLAEDKHGNLWVANSGGSQILVYNSKNQQLTSETITDKVDAPAGLAFDKKGDLYAVERYSNKVTVYSPSRKLIKTLHTTKTFTFTPSGIAIAPNGDVWVASRDDNNFSIGEVEVFNASGRVIHALTQNLEYPDGITFRGSDAWVCDATSPSGNALTVFDSTGKYVETVDTTNFTPTYAAQDSKGDLYVTNGLSTDIAILNGSGKVLKTTSNKGLDLPYGIVFTKAGNFYVANVDTNTITEYDSRGKLIHTIQ